MVRISRSEIPLEMWEEYGRTKDVLLRNRIAEHYLYLVRSIARNLIARFPATVDFDDLCSDGFLGLIHAIEGFDASLNIKFRTYAMNRIRGEMIDQIREQDWMPRLQRSRLKLFRALSVRTEVAFERAPLLHEIQAELGISESEARAFLISPQVRQVQLADDESDDSRKKFSINSIPDRRSQDYSDEADSPEWGSLLAFLEKTLSEREKVILRLYYGDGVPMLQIAFLLGVTESRVCQIHTALIERLKGFKQERLERIFRADGH